MTSNANNPAKVINLYNSDGTLTSNRNVNLGAANLTINGTGAAIFNNNIVNLSSNPRLNIDSAGVVGGRLTVLTNGNVGIGQPNPNAQLHLGNTSVNRKIILWETANNEHEFSGLGINAKVLRYQVPALDNDHVFYAALNSTSSNEIARITGSGKLLVGTSWSPHKVEFAGGSVNINGENVAFGIDAGPISRLGVIKKSGFAPIIASDNTSDLIFGKTNQAGVHTNISTATLTEFARFSAGTGNLGVGKSPDANAKLDVAGNISLNGNTFFLKAAWDTNHRITAGPGGLVDGANIYGAQGGSLNGANNSSNALVWTSTQRIGVGGVAAPLNTLHVGAPAVANTTGIRTNITNASTATSETSYLAANASGDIVLGAPISPGGSSLPAPAFAQTTNMEFGAAVGALKEFALSINGSSQLTITRRHSATATSFFIYNSWNGDGVTSGRVTRGQSTFPLNTAIVISLDAAGAARALSNNTNVSAILTGDGKVIEVQAWNNGGGIMMMARQLI